MHALSGRFESGAHALRYEVTPARPVVADHEGLLVAIVGTPQFLEPELRKVALTSSPGAALAIGFRAYGSGVLDKIVGKFSLAVIDTKDESLLLAIDRSGMATMCYAIYASVVYFGLNAEDVTTQFLSAAEIDPQSTFDYLFCHTISSPATIFRDVFRLEPGQCLKVVRGSAQLSLYHQIQYQENDARSFEDLREEFLGLLRESVRGSIRDPLKNESYANHRIGAFLSGGTDSSTVAGILGEVTGSAANTYSIGFDAAGFDEMSYARIAAKHFGCRHHEYYVTPDDLADNIAAVAAAYDQPFGNSSALPAFCCARLARADGVDIMLGGDGGDELFGGNTRYAKQRVFSAYGSVPDWIRALVEPALQPDFVERLPLLRKARSYIEQAKVPMPDRLQTYNLLTRMGYSTVLEPHFLSEVDTTLPTTRLREWYARSRAPSLINRMLALDLKITLADNDLPKVVRTCELAGLESAFPFLDARMVRFAATLPPEYKLRGLRLRWFFKQALRDFLPAEILVKQKHGFGLPFGIWLGQHARLRDLAFGSLEGLGKRGIVRPEFIRRLTSEFLAGHATYYGEFVWILMMLEQWFLARAPSTRL